MIAERLLPCLLIRLKSLYALLDGQERELEVGKNKALSPLLKTPLVPLPKIHQRLHALQCRIHLRTQTS